MQAHNTFVSQTANFGQAKKKAPQVNRMQNAKWAQAGRIGCKICISDADGASGARQEILYQDTLPDLYIQNEMTL